MEDNKIFKNMIEKLREHLKNRTPEQIEEDRKFFEDKRPKGWLSIEEYLPSMSAYDFCEKGYSVFKVRYSDGREGESVVCDHNTWYYEARDSGITHWLNE